MTSVRLKIALAVLALVSIPLAATLARPADNELDSPAIHKIYADFNDSLNNHDAHAVAMLFAEDADFLQGTNHSNGREAIEHRLGPLFARRGMNLHREVTLQRIRFLRPDVAAVYGEYDQSGLMSQDGTAAPPSKGLYDWIVVKDNGRWLISVWHESDLPTTLPTASSAR